MNRKYMVRLAGNIEYLPHSNGMNACNEPKFTISNCVCRASLWWICQSSLVHRNGSGGETIQCYLNFWNCSYFADIFRSYPYHSTLFISVLAFQCEAFCEIFLSVVAIVDYLWFEIVQKPIPNTYHHITIAVYRSTAIVALESKKCTHCCIIATHVESKVQIFKGPSPPTVKPFSMAIIIRIILSCSLLLRICNAF